LEIAQKVYEQGIDLVYLMEKLTEFFRELLVIKAFPKESKIGFQTPELRELILEHELEDILLIFQSLVKDLEVLRRSNYPQLQFELTMLRICEYGKLVPLREIIEKLDQITSNNFSISIPSPSSEEKIVEKEEKSWKKFVEEIKKENLPLYGLVSSLPKPEIRQNEVFLKISSSSNFTESPYYKLLKEKIETYFNKPLRVEIEEVKRTTLEDVKEREEVKKILDIFSAKIAYIQPLKE
jgi:DNA polymerase-3 subunit gamma/tau